MNIVVLGAGAVGGYFGGRLAKAGFPVTFLVRNHRYNQLTETGLQVRSTHGDFTIAPRLAQSAADIQDPDIVIVAVKNYHLQDAMPELRKLAQKGACILPLLNGVQHIDVLQAEFGPETVLGGTCFIEATLDNEGGVVHSSPMAEVIFGAFAPVNESIVHELEANFRASGVDARSSSTILVDIWRKFIFLTVFSGITAATRKPIGDIRADAVTFKFLQDMVDEITFLAHRRQIQLPTETLEETTNKLRSLPPTMTSSLHRDLEKGLPLEIDSLQGAVLEMAAACDLETPCVRSVYALLHPYK